MIRSMRLAVGFVAILSLTGPDARAQWGYGGWGWGGWGGGASTLQGGVLQGAAQYAMGAGMYNLDTAQARSINADTAMRYNDYMARVAAESAKDHAARVNQQFARNQSLYDARQRQLRDNPSQRDVEQGDALNLAVQDLSNPRLGSSALRAANIPVSASLIATIPFIYASERITFMLDDIRASVKWPEVFEGEQYVNDKKTFDELAAKLRRETGGGEVSSQEPTGGQRFCAILWRQAASPAAEGSGRSEGSATVPHRLHVGAGLAREAEYRSGAPRAPESQGHHDWQPYLASCTSTISSSAWRKHLRRSKPTISYSRSSTRRVTRFWPKPSWIPRPRSEPTRRPRPTFSAT